MHFIFENDTKAIHLAFGKHTIIQVPAMKPITEPDQSFPGVCFQENGSVIIDNTPAFHVEQSHKPAQSHQGPLISEEYYLKLKSPTPSI